MGRGVTVAGDGEAPATNFMKHRVAVSMKPATDLNAGRQSAASVALNFAPRRQQPG